MTDKSVETNKPTAQISELLAAKSVALRLTAGTQEVGFLSSFCPINKVPTLVVIK